MKTKQSPLTLGLYVSILSLVFIACIGCSKDEIEPGPEQPNFSNDEAEAFDAAVAQLQAFSQPTETSVQEDAATDPERDTEDTALECVTRTYKGAPGFNELFTLDPTTDVIYPGSMLKGESIPTGEYTRISADRAPITMSISLSNITGKSSVTVNDPNKLSEVRDGINELLNREVTGATPAQLVVTESEVYSEEHLSVAVAANYRDATKDVSANLDFNNSSYKNKYVLKFLQRYFTLDLDSPGKSPSDMFTNLPNLESLGTTNPVYVSSVTYGRMVLYTIESDSTISQVKGAFDAAIEAGKKEGEFELDVESKEIITNSSIKALIIGGSGESAAQAISGVENNPAQIYEYIAEGGNYSNDSPGAPLAYKLSYVKEGFPAAKVVLSTEYQIRDCDVAYPEFQVTIDKITGTQPSDTEVNGSLNMKMKVGTDYLDINNNGIDDGPYWNRGTSNFVDVQNDKTHNIGEVYVLKPYRPNMAVDQIEYYGNLYDYNGILGNANLGEHTGTVKLDDLKMNEEETYTLNFNAGITAHFKITRIK